MAEVMVIEGYDLRPSQKRVLQRLPCSLGSLAMGESPHTVGTVSRFLMERTWGEELKLPMNSQFETASCHVSVPSEKPFLQPQRSPRVTAIRRDPEPEPAG